MNYRKLAELYKSLEGTTKRLEKTGILAGFLKEVSGDNKDILYLLIGSVFPEQEEKKIGISSQLAIKAIAKATGKEDKEVVHEWKTIGDLGEVAEKLKKSGRQSTLRSGVLTTRKVIENLRKLPQLEGKGTVEKKISLIVELLSSASPIESKYIIRTVIGDLRIGLKSSTVRDAMARAFYPEGKRKEAAEEIQSAYDLNPDLAKIFELAKKGKNFSIELKAGNPIKVMLAQKAKTIEEAFEKAGKPLAAEYKYDGFRMMINKKPGDKEISLYTRRLENVTRQFPDIVEVVKKHIRAKSFIVDSEIVGYDPKTKKYVPFQNISQRIKRKYEIEKLIKNLPVEVKAFDIVYLNGRNLIKEPFEKRAGILRKIIKNEKYKISSADQRITKSEKEVRDFYKKAIRENQEGLMLKNLKAPYKPGSRVGFMLKLKEELRDFDLVITGAEYGTGKRSGWMSSFILSCKDTKTHKFLEIGKVGTGIKEKFGSQEEKSSSSTDVTFHELTEMLKPLITKESGKDVEVKPKVVVSVTYQEIQKSPNYSSGFALRFPRFTALRDDKPLSEITTLEEIKEEYARQER